MFRSTLCFQRAKKAAVSPYAVFLMDKKGSPALQGLEFEKRGKACGKMWQGTPAEQKKALAIKAANSPQFDVKTKKNFTPLLARWMRRDWDVTPQKLNFEGKAKFITEQFLKSHQ